MVNPNELFSLLLWHFPCRIHTGGRRRGVWISVLQIGDFSTLTFCLTLCNCQPLSFLCLAPLLIFALHLDYFYQKIQILYSCSYIIPLDTGFISMTLHNVSMVKTCPLHHAYCSVKSAVSWCSTDTARSIILTFGFPVSAPMVKNLQVLTPIITTRKGWANENLMTYVGPIRKLR